MPTMYVVPAEGRQVRDPRDGQPIPAEGKEVTDSPFWRRRVKDGDVSKQKSPKILPTPKKPKEE